MFSASRLLPRIAAAAWLAATSAAQSARDAATATEQTRNVLFIGNSYTTRHHLYEVVKTMAEAMHPGLHFEATAIIFGGRTLQDHWRLGTQNVLKASTLTVDEVRMTLASLEQERVNTPNDKQVQSAITRQRHLLASFARPRKKWDVVVLQSYGDDTPGSSRSYFEFAPKFAALAKEQGARVILYETTPSTQNAHPLTAPPDKTLVWHKERAIARLAAKLGASVVPMSAVALQCQTMRPEWTLRYVNDGHLNQRMAYLTACTFQAALFERSAQGVRVDVITDTQPLDAAHPDRDKDGNPIAQLFSSADQEEMQRIAWDGYQMFQRQAGREK